MSLHIENIKKIKLSCRKSLDSELKENQIVLKENQKKLLETEQNLYSVEDKWIKNDITKETFERWSDLYNNEIKVLNTIIERLSNNQNKAYKILEKNLKCLSDIRQIYSKASTIEKREFVNLVFDSNLYYENGIYRTPTMLGIFSHNCLKMKDKGLLVYKKKESSY